MLTILSFLIMMIGGVNWLLIGLLQYDFIAGIFGYQGSVFSRIIYILFGIATAIFAFKVIKCKGKVSIFSRRNKEDLAKNMAKMKKSPAPADVEASSEELPRQERHEQYHEEKEEGLLNEHFHDDQ